MAPTRKNAKGTVQSTTILSFFGTDTPSKSKPKPAKTPAKAKQKAAFQDVIVIDSDSDDDLQSASPRKKARTSGGEDDGIEIVQRVSKSQSSGSAPLGGFGEPSDLLRVPRPKTEPEEQSVIVPSTPSTGDLCQPTRPNPAPIQASSSCSNPGQSLPESCSSEALQKPATSSSSDFPMDIDSDSLFGDDSWEMGDPEEPFLDNDNPDSANQNDDWDGDIDDFSVTISPPPADQTTRKALTPLRAQSELPSADRKGKGKAPSTPCPKSGPNAFSLLMSSHSENAAWKEATIAEDRNFRPSKENGSRRKAPFYKVLQGMPIAVDAFRYGKIPNVTAYFLTHAHSDHYTNLSSNWKNGPIYCSEGTANLIIHMLAVDKKWVHPLPMDVPTIIPNTGGVQVTLIEANHCPGSSLFMFEGKQTVNAGDSTYKSSFVGSSKTFRYLHCGDFRASPKHVLHPAVKGKRIDHVYLDTTYLDPKYTFPPQPQVISACADLAARIKSGDSILDNTPTVASFMSANGSVKSEDKDIKPAKDRILFVVGTYSIGKERIVKAIAKSLNTKVYCDPRKIGILRCQADAELDALLSTNPTEAAVHLVPLGVVSSDKLKDYVERFKGSYSRAVGFRPTGWTFTPSAGTDLIPSIPSLISRCQNRSYTHANLKPSRNSTAQLQLFPVPYSEHSSFFELTCFAMSFEWGKMIATVNVGSETSRGKMTKWVERWERERKSKGQGLVPPRHAEYW